MKRLQSQAYAAFKKGYYLSSAIIGKVYEQWASAQAQSWLIERPIFLVGCPRSGTTLLNRLLSTHQDLAHFTIANANEPELLLWSNSIAQLIGMKDRLNPTEANGIWQRYCPGINDRLISTLNHFITEKDVTPEARQYFYFMIQKSCYWFKTKRFLNKSPFNSVRLRYLNEIFPDAIFLHIIRDGRAVTSSILEQRQYWFKDQRILWNVKPQKWKDLLEKESIDSAAYQWSRLIEDIRKQSKFLCLTKERYREVLYSVFD